MILAIKALCGAILIGAGSAWLICHPQATAIGTTINVVAFISMCAGVAVLIKTLYEETKSL